jgi:hypothetical protein
MAPRITVAELRCRHSHSEGPAPEAALLLARKILVGVATKRECSNLAHEPAGDIFPV